MAHFLYALTSSNLDRFSNSFHCQNRENICNNTVTNDPTTHQVCRYTTLWIVSVLKATTENKTTSLAIHLRCGGIFSDSIIINVLLILTVNEFEIWCKYLMKLRCTKSVPFFGPPWMYIHSDITKYSFRTATVLNRIAHLKTFFTTTSRKEICCPLQNVK